MIIIKLKNKSHNLLLNIDLTQSALKKIKSLDASSLDYQISIDTIVLRAKLDDEQLDTIFDYFMYHYKQSKKYHYNLNLIKQYGIMIQILPTEPMYHKHFNTTITLTPLFFQLDYIPHSIIDLLTELPLSIVRMDIATDFTTEYKDNVCLLKYHAKQTEFLYKSETKYMGKRQSKLSAISYDRNQKARARKLNIQYSNSNRVEARLRFKMHEQMLPFINHTTIRERLSKIMYIHSIDDLHEIDGYSKNRLKKLHNNNSYLKKFGVNEQKKIKSYLKLKRVPLEQLYQQHQQKLFSFMQKRERELKQVA